MCIYVYIYIEERETKGRQSEKGGGRKGLFVLSTHDFIAIIYRLNLVADETGGILILLSRDTITVIIPYPFISKRRNVFATWLLYSTGQEKTFIVEKFERATYLNGIFYSGSRRNRSGDRGK